MENTRLQGRVWRGGSRDLLQHQHQHQAGDRGHGSGSAGTATLCHCPDRGHGSGDTGVAVLGQPIVGNGDREL